MKISDILKIRKRSVRNIVGAKKMEYCELNVKTLEIFTAYTLLLIFVYLKGCQTLPNVFNKNRLKVSYFLIA